MIAEKDPYIANAAQTLYRACVDERFRNFCEGREEGEKTLRTLQMQVQQKEAENARLRAELEALKQNKK